MEHRRRVRALHHRPPAPPRAHPVSRADRRWARAAVVSPVTGHVAADNAKSFAQRTQRIAKDAAGIESRSPPRLFASSLLLLFPPISPSPNPPIPPSTPSHQSPVHYTFKLASTETSTFPFRALDTGQPSFAAAAASRKAAASIPGTSPTTSSFIDLIDAPWSTSN